MPALTPAQRDVLKAAGRGEISTPGPEHGFYDVGTWREGGDTGRAVTVVAQALIAKGFAQPSEQIIGGRRPLAVTAAGNEALSAAAHHPQKRRRRPTQNGATSE